MYPASRPLLVALFALAAPLFATPEPWADAPPPVVQTSLHRSEVVLNGLWDFQPARGPSKDRPAEDAWVRARVPGVWDRTTYPVPVLDGPLSRGTGAVWEGLELFTPNRMHLGKVLRSAGKMESIVDRAWYARSFTVPQDWSGRQILISFERVSTDARVYIDGSQVGELHWPGGELDVTEHVRPGATHTLRLLVVAVAKEGDVTTFMDADRPQTQRASLDTRGITGDVVLHAVPKGPNLVGLFIQPSVRNRTLTVDVERTAGWTPGRHTVEVTAREWPSGVKARDWTRSIEVSAGDAPLQVVLDWENPKLWDFEQPNLYTLELAVRAPGAQAAFDSVSERFGFREYRIDGRRMLLNELPFNWRLHGISENISEPSLLKAHLRDHVAAGFNIAYIWPEDMSMRGKPNHRTDIARLCDELGLPMAVGFPSADPYFDALNLEPPAPALAAWRTAVRREFVRLRNSPAVVVWLFQGNRFSHGDDQNPHRIGQSERLPHSEAWMASRRGAQLRLDELAALDPTRPVTSHHSVLGAINTSNIYLNLHPLQERLDWLSAWAERGDRPFSAVEFDAPFSATLNRGRAGHTGQSDSEPLLTEFIATYFGPRAYSEEDAAYRAAIPRWHRQGMTYAGVNNTNNEAFHAFAAWWIRQTWRAWRSWGIPGGMWAWSSAHGWSGVAPAERQLPAEPWKPGQRGAWVPAMQERSVLRFAEPTQRMHPSGSALVAAHTRALAWIAGHPEPSPAAGLGGPGSSFTDATHQFRSKAPVRKQLALLNDTRTPQNYTATVTASVAGREVYRDTLTGRLPVGEPVFRPFSFQAPAVSDRTAGIIRMNATIGGVAQEDSFEFRVYPVETPASAPGPRLLVLDPSGDTARMLRGAGAQLVPWDGRTAPDVARHPALVVGRNALSALELSEAQAVGKRLADYANAGGLVLLQGQDPQWLRTYTPLRFHQHVTRRLWPVPTLASHPLVDGLDGEDFRDWTGSGTLRTPEENTELQKTSLRFPDLGWRWGNRGSVASLMLEKPHRSGWTPLMEGEFDLAYTPLAEVRFGKGRVILNGLDLEGANRGPVAMLMARRLVHYLQSPRALPAARPVVYLGGEADETRLRALGVGFMRGDRLPGTDALLVLGRDASVSDAELETFLRAGGRALVLPRTTVRVPGGPSLEVGGYDGAGGILPDWEELRGLSFSDLRARTTVQVPLLQPGGAVETAANGALGRWVAGSGRAVYVQLDPDGLNADEKTYLRFTRWRFTRLLSQVLANLGAQFELDAQLFAFAPAQAGEVGIGGPWLMATEAMLGDNPASPDHAPADPGDTGFDRGWASTEFDDTTWRRVLLPGMLENLDGSFREKTWVVWFRRTIDVPEGWSLSRTQLELGPLDDWDTVYVNGMRVGMTDGKTNAWWSTPRIYKLRPGTLQPGRNVIAVRLFNRFGGGGFGAATPNTMKLTLVPPPRRPAPYHPDYRSDHAQGDDPARYYRW